MVSHIFISYASKDESVASEICQAFESQGLECWLAPRNVGIGENWEAAILSAIEASRFVILVFSSQSNLSRDIAREIHHAFRKDKLVIPVRIEDAKPIGNLAYLLSNVQWLDAVKHSTSHDRQ